MTCDDRWQQALVRKDTVPSRKSKTEQHCKRPYPEQTPRSLNVPSSTPAATDDALIAQMEALVGGLEAQLREADRLAREQNRRIRNLKEANRRPKRQ